MKWLARTFLTLIALGTTALLAAGWLVVAAQNGWLVAFAVFPGMLIFALLGVAAIYAAFPDE